jgi:hypothetical protein
VFGKSDLLDQDAPDLEWRGRAPVVDGRRWADRTSVLTAVVETPLELGLARLAQRHGQLRAEQVGIGR